MFSFEKKILNRIEKKLWLFVLIAAFVFGVFLRYKLRNFISEDMYKYLLVWYEEIKNAGGLKALSSQTGNYNVLYQFVISLFTYIPVSPVFAIKGLSILFDLLLASFAGLYLYDAKEKRDILKGVCGFSLIWLSPIVVMNSSMWGQCDSIYVFFTVIALFFLEKEKFIKAFVFLGLALSFKLQAVFILPYFVYRYLKYKKFSILNFLIVPGVMMLSTLPAIIAGRGLFTGFSIYFAQTEDYGCLTMNSPSLISLIAYSYQQHGYEYLAPFFILITAVTVGALIVYMLSKKIKISTDTEFAFAFFLSYTMVFLLPAMHERYGYLYEILALILCFKNKKTIIPCLVLQLISLCGYGYYLLEGTVPALVLTILNIFAFSSYAFLFIKEVKASESEAA